MQQLPNRGSFSSLSVLTRAATARAQIEKETGATSKVVQIAKIRINPQVRRDFSDIADFAERLKVVGHVHTPILLREIKGEEAYELIAGERRVRGSIANKWDEIPAKVFPADTPDLKLRKYQVSENIDRKRKRP
jgi:ParB family chromosome partitioning protein